MNRKRFNDFWIKKNLYKINHIEIKLIKEERRLPVAAISWVETFV